MKEIEYLQIHNDLVDIIHYAFLDFDDYAKECYGKGVSPVEEVEDYVADAVIRAGYRKQSEGEWIQQPIPYEDEIVCTVCGANFNVIDNCTEKFNYCPNCGAEMRKEDEGK